LVEHWVEWRRRLRGEDSREIEKLGKEPKLTEVVIGEEWYDEKMGKGGIVVSFFLFLEGGKEEEEEDATSLS